MSANPYQSPTSPVAIDARGPRYHRRSLTYGVIGAALAPVLLVALPMAMNSSSLDGLMWVCLIALVPTTLTAVLIALPTVLLLRWWGHLRGTYVCMAGLLLGAGLGAGIVFSDFLLRLSDWEGSSLQASSMLRGAMLVGTGGLAASLGMVFGAGIPFRRRRDVPSA